MRKLLWLGGLGAVAALTALVAMPVNVAAQSPGFAGHWLLRSGNGNTQGTTLFVVNGNQLTGTISNSSDTVNVEDGKINGNQASWVTNRGGTKYVWSATLSADGNSGQFSRQGGTSGLTKLSASRLPETLGAGHWKFPKGSADFVVKGTKLTGNVYGGSDGTSKVEDGKIDGNKISFEVTDGGKRYYWKGTVSADNTRLDLVRSTSSSDRTNVTGVR